MSLQWPDTGSRPTCAAKQHYRCSEFNVVFVLRQSAVCQIIRSVNSSSRKMIPSLGGTVVMSWHAHAVNDMGCCGAV